MGNDVVHQVLADGLRAFVEKVTFILSNGFKSNGLFLIANLLRRCFFSSNASIFSPVSFIALVFFLFSCNERTYLIFLNRILSNLFLGLISSFAFYTAFNGSRLPQTFLTLCHVGKLLFVGFSFVKFLEESIVRSCDEVEAARFAVLLTEACDHIESFLLILNIIRF